MSLKNTNYFVPKVYLKFCVKHKLLTTYIARKPIPLKVGFIGLIASTVVIFTVVLLIVVGTKKNKTLLYFKKAKVLSNSNILNSQKVVNKLYNFYYHKHFSYN